MGAECSCWMSSYSQSTGSLEHTPSKSLLWGSMLSKGWGRSPLILEEFPGPPWKLRLPTKIHKTMPALGWSIFQGKLPNQGREMRFRYPCLAIAMPLSTSFEFVLFARSCFCGLSPPNNNSIRRLCTTPGGSKADRSGGAGIVVLVDPQLALCEGCAR